MTADQKSRVAELKAEIAATATSAGTPVNVRAAAVVLKQELRRDGITARAVASAVGVPESTLCQWE
jgi:16S rRNA G527 N7-methylase RsmG